MTFVGQAGRRGVQGGISGQICSPIIRDSSDTLGFVRQSESGVAEAIRSANLTSFAAATRCAGAERHPSSTEPVLLGWSPAWTRHKDAQLHPQPELYLNLCVMKQL